MKTLIISDTHLSDDFEQKKFDFLYQLFSEADHIIINGDLWEGEEITFSHFLESRWKGLFPLLKQKKAVYLYGNHDKKPRSNERVSVFSAQQGFQYVLPFSKYRLYIEHGHELVSFEKEYKALLLISKILGRRIFSKIFNLVELTWIFLSLEGIESHHQKFNRYIKKNWKNGSSKPTDLLIIGHVHAPDFDLEHQFINGGYIKHGIAQYIVIEDNTLLLLKQHYRTDQLPEILNSLDLGSPTRQ